MKKLTTIEEGVDSALKILGASTDRQWKYVRKGEGELYDKLILDGEEYPFFWWRFDIQVSYLVSIAPVRRPCSVKLNRSCAASEGLEALLYREVDIAEQILSSDLSKLTCFRNGASLDMIAKAENGRVAVFELAAVLNDGTEEQGRHTYWGEDGMASDRVVSQKLASEAIYLFTEDSPEPETYNDLFIYMYGLNKLDTVKASAIVEVLLGRVDPSEWRARDGHIRSCIAAANESAKAVKSITL